MKQRIYAVYKKDEILFIGNITETAKFFNVKKSTVRFWASHVNKKRCLDYKECGGRKIAETFYEDY